MTQADGATSVWSLTCQPQFLSCAAIEPHNESAPVLGAACLALRDLFLCDERIVVPRQPRHQLVERVVRGRGRRAQHYSDESTYILANRNFRLTAFGSRPFQTSAASDACVLRDCNNLKLLTGCTCYIPNSFAHQKPCHWGCEGN